jgi:hypothetical protein
MHSPQNIYLKIKNQMDLKLDKSNIDNFLL